MPGSRRHHGDSWPLDVPQADEECEREQADGERGWRSLMTVDSEEEPEEAIVYCPRCAEREFGPRDERRR